MALQSPPGSGLSGFIDLPCRPADLIGMPRGHRLSPPMLDDNM
ncbi:hypothetical protein [Mesorhizobium sp.]|nr:hypothetical protein [Mesorhizobium sp.]